MASAVLLAASAVLLVTSAVLLVASVVLLAVSLVLLAVSAVFPCPYHLRTLWVLLAELAELYESQALRR